MALPKLNALPQYEIIIPSTKKAIKYRPFLVKEQKILLMALETQDQKAVYNAIVNVIEACIEDGTDVNKLTSYDVEYLFLMIRGKSVGETIDVKMVCQHDGCDATTEVRIPIDDIAVPSAASKSTIVKLTDDISIELEHPSITRVQEVSLSDGMSQTEALLQLMKAAISVVHTDEERIVFKQETKQEQDDFLDSLSGKQLNEIMEFVQAMPAVSHDIEWTCSGCGKQNKRTLRGLTDFFS